MQKDELRNEVINSVAKDLGLTSVRFQSRGMSENAEYCIKKTKKKDKPILKADEWCKEGYWKMDICDKLLRDCPDEIERIDYENLSIEEFIEKYESKSKPVIIKGLTKSWNPEKNWTFENVYKRYKNDKFEVGKDEKGYPVRIKLKYFFEYLVNQQDDSPLYLFESALEDRKEAKQMTNHFQVPKYFSDDILSIMGEENRPPFRWFLIGPKRSGTTVHIDPIMTSAWNASLVGHKRWVLFPQETPKQIVKGKQYLGLEQEYEAITYFTHLLPKIKENEKGNIKTIEFIQYPGEVVFVPGGWWHAVVNIDNTMALTQNFVSYTNFEKVWKSVREERKRFACKLLEKLKEKHPKLYEKAVQMNKQDNFLMHNETKLLEKRKAEYELKDETQKKKEIEPIISSSSDPSISSSSYSPSSSSDSSSQKYPGYWL